MCKTRNSVFLGKFVVLPPSIPENMLPLEWQVKRRFDRLCPRAKQFVEAPNQYERAILQIQEANDVPKELWYHVRQDSCKHKDFFDKQYAVYKEKCIRLAIQHFRDENVSLQWEPIENVKFDLDE